MEVLLYSVVRLMNFANSISNLFEDLTSFGPVAAKAKLVEKIHAVSMLLAWILFANLGAFTARYCKTIFQVQGWSALTISHCQVLQDHIPGTRLA
jgi:hypothetical protein